MKRKIQIPATREIKRFIRVFTCWNHQIQRSVVDTEEYYSEIQIPYGVNLPSHEQIISKIRSWKKHNDVIVFAYWIVETEFIADDRSQWSHESRETRRKIQSIGKKIYVYTCRFGCSVITRVNLKDDAAFIRNARKRIDRARSYVDQKKLEESLEATARDRRITHYTMPAHQGLVDRRVRLDTKLLKLGPATYVVINDDMEYRPEKDLNIEPER